MEIKININEKTRGQLKRLKDLPVKNMLKDVLETMAIHAREDALDSYGKFINDTFGAYTEKEEQETIENENT